MVDPVRTPTAAAADLHLAPFPGSDAALAFALAHVIARDGLLDRELLSEHAVGFEELEPLLEPCTPAWGEAATGVPSTLIEEAARRYGEGPSMLWIGQGFQRQPHGGNAVRAVGALAALSGNLGRPGTGVLYLNGAHSRALDEDYVAGVSLRGPDMPEPVSHMDLVERLGDRHASRALFCWNINIAASNPEQTRLRAALAREDLFTVAIDLFATDTTDFADVVLPAASFLESDDIVASYFHLCLGAQVKAVEPPGDALPNTEIFRRLAAAMGFEEPELHESDTQVIANLLAPTGIDFAALAAAGTVWIDRRAADPIRRPALSDAQRAHRAGERACGSRRSPPRSRSPTPTRGRAPDCCACSPLPPPGSSTTPSPTTASSPGAIGAATVAVHPADAAQRGLAEGDDVVLANDCGRLAVTLALSDLLPRGVAYAPKGRWPKLEASHANVNVLNPGDRSDMGDSTAVHGVEVTLKRA